MSLSTPLNLPLDPEARADLAAMAERSIARGSKSFAAAARLFDAETRKSAMMLYAWCRHCDDAIDDQRLGFARRRLATEPSPAERLEALERETLAALAGAPTAEPSFRAIADVSARHGLPQGLVLDHLAGYRMDVEERRYDTIGETLQYCYHVAGVVGVMMAIVMKAEGEDALDRACDLGIAFQLTNIARDIVEDARVGRIYLPREWLAEADITPAQILDPRFRPVVALLAHRLVDLAEPYYGSAFHGLGALSLRSAWAVAMAHGVYREIGLEVKALGPAAWDRRAATGRTSKLRHVALGAAKAGLARRTRVQERPATLWTRPRPAKPS
ncbi:phytoene/squalene synthase family protein [Aurantimonas sp. VKM B-3413]|uniref:phytoene/squalene synthase family protein n=1 Tax=Aurantimonas sp. VKM B-3413 TaxID=2779401 RepID=UPI001E57132E|nr:phytoene/squalene synthase family protein [Aurantimonas sp. VKM B-3413]